MNNIKRVKKILGNARYKYRKWEYARKQKVGFPIELTLPGKTKVRLYPEGQIAELLNTTRFESAEIALVTRYLKPGMNVVDVGANIGLYSILANSVVGPAGCIWAFEPSTESFERLRKNLSINSARSVKPFRLALGDKQGKILLKRDPGFGDGERYVTKQDTLNEGNVADQLDSGDCELVESTTLDLFFRDLPEARIDFLKADIEGGELAMFMGAQNILNLNIDVMIMFECSESYTRRAGHTQNEVFSFLRKLGFKLFSWTSDSQTWEISEKNIGVNDNVFACRNEQRLPQIVTGWR